MSMLELWMVVCTFEGILIGCACGKALENKHGFRSGEVIYGCGAVGFFVAVLAMAATASVGPVGKAIAALVIGPIIMLWLFVGSPILYYFLRQLVKLIDAVYNKTVCCIEWFLNRCSLSGK